jgi:hypothetical protein
MRADPLLALQVDVGLRTHCKPNTVSSYGTGAKDYLKFCRKRGITPWPVTEVEYCGWLHTLLTHIKIQSVGVYMAGVRDASILGGHAWEMTGNEFVRRTMRFLRTSTRWSQGARKCPLLWGYCIRSSHF